MKKENWKQLLISILIGAGVAFFSTLFQSLADFFREHATNMVAGGASSLAYLIRFYRG